MDLSFLNMSVKETTSRISPKELKDLAATLSLEQIPPFLAALELETIESKNSNKLLALIEGLTQRTQITAAGKALSIKQLYILLENHQEIEKNAPWKMHSLLIGITPKLFRDLLFIAREDIFSILKKEAIAEPIQHHLNTLSHEMSVEMTIYDAMIKDLYEQILKLDFSIAKRKDIQEIHSKMNELVENLEKTLICIEHALTITWNTNRVDLIEKFTMIKEHLLKTINFSIGQPSDSALKESLYGTIKKSIDAFYSQSNEALEDNDLAIEALARFSIWYAEDYADIGLLPEAKDLVSSSKMSENEWVTAQIKLNTLVQEQLKKQGLVTVKDLKEAYIFSKESLKEFLEMNQ